MVYSGAAHYTGICTVSTNKADDNLMPKKPPSRRPPVKVVDTKGTPGGLGTRLRSAREEAQISLRELARRVDVSPSLVSQIERGSVRPSVGTLYAMSTELGLLLDDLFKDGAAAPKASSRVRAAVVTEPGPVQRQSRRKAIKLASGVRWELLTATPDKDLEFLRVMYDVGGASCDKDALMRHGGKEYAFMISGRLGLKIGFEEFELGPGDSVSFDAQTPHRLWAIGNEPAVAIWVVLNRNGDSRMRGSVRKTR
jgi:transcriptional regulator with XRE-family HTH domain